MTHLGERVLDAGTGLANAGVALLLACAQGLARLGLALDVFAIAQCPKHFAALRAGVALVGIDITAGVALIKHRIEVRAVMLAGSAGDNFADEFVPPVHADAELVAVVAFAVFLGMGGVQGLLPALGLAPVFGGLALCKLPFLLLDVVLDGRGHLGCVDDLSAARHEPLALQQPVHCLEQRCQAFDAQALLVVPDGVPVGDGDAVGQ